MIPKVLLQASNGFIHSFLVDRSPHYYFAPGEMAERSNAAVLKTVDCQRSGGSNPSLSANSLAINLLRGFFVLCHRCFSALLICFPAILAALPTQRCLICNNILPKSGRRYPMSREQIKKSCNPLLAVIMRSMTGSEDMNHADIAHNRTLCTLKRGGSSTSCTQRFGVATGYAVAAEDRF
jgi:hypothetical protein